MRSSRLYCNATDNREMHEESFKSLDDIDWVSGGHNTSESQWGRSTSENPALGVF